LKYRREIDGLRAFAVLPVIFFHAGFKTFSGGYVGVDVFFVISGYLITTIILAELEKGKFSIIDFYDRRARRILPALFLIMIFSLVFGYICLMPDEFKNFGQSLVATSLFSNNILLSLTNGYWNLSNEFKPLLHTWSLNVEEQYYVIVPIFLILFWRLGKNSILYFLWVIFFSSFFFAIWFVNVSPNLAFFILPTRAWEICIGALASIYLSRYPSIANNQKLSGALSFVGFALIMISIFSFDNTVLSPSYLLLIPTIGALLIIIFCQPSTFVFKILGNKILVFIGLLSYSLYLWHQPVFAYLRVNSLEPPSALNFLAIFPLVLILAFFTWKFVEAPFRNKIFIRRKNVFRIFIIFSILFVLIGLVLNKTHGLPQRLFDSTITIGDFDSTITIGDFDSTITIGDMDKKKYKYNMRVFSYKKNKFNQTSFIKILIIGNSFARDFTNITLENFNISNVEIIYRDDLSGCIGSKINQSTNNLFFETDVIVFASGVYDKNCYSKDISFASINNKKIYYVGIKDFGYNLNWLIHLKKDERRNQFNVISKEIIASDKEMSELIPHEHFISLLSPTLVRDKIPITDELGRMLSIDRAHLTKYGAIYFSKKIFFDTSYSKLFM
jgi:peptidoglycan/LPS O-acetylase OafA/YrhL